MTQFKPFVLLENSCTRHGASFIYLMKHFKSLSRNFPQLEQNFLVYSLFYIQMDILNKRRYKQKNVKKMDWLQNEKVQTKACV